jgi:hypothetical protein
MSIRNHRCQPDAMHATIAATQTTVVNARQAASPGGRVGCWVRTTLGFGSGATVGADSRCERAVGRSGRGAGRSMKSGSRSAAKRAVSAASIRCSNSVWSSRPAVTCSRRHSTARSRSRSPIRTVRFPVDPNVGPVGEVVTPRVWSPTVSSGHGICHRPGESQGQPLIDHPRVPGAPAPAASCAASPAAPARRDLGPSCSPRSN